MENRLLDVDLARDEEMTIKQEDWKRITGEISTQVGTALEGRAEPNGWKRAGETIRAWGAPVAIIAVIIALLGITISALYQAFSHVKEETEFRTNTKNKLDSIERQMFSLRALESSSQPLLKQNQDAAKDLIVEAKWSGVEIPAPIVERAAERFLEAGLQDPNAWAVAQEFLSYRTSMNKSDVRPAGVVPEPTRYTIQTVNGKPASQLFQAAVGAPINESARLEVIGQNLNSDVRTGARFLILRGGAESLDNMSVRNVILDNVEVYYTGKPVTLENVVFVSCKFAFSSDDHSLALSEKILSSSPVNFKPAP